ncbi:gamma-glutamyl-gamma-aminobutyrate hydrolase family protein [Planctomycetales bacterium ZRK34]|nr:gamma-glutamyl-gamma-aminobutyrate hydrolase family protein [Planctomycetales bacterium ZRK34]
MKPLIGVTCDTHRHRAPDDFAYDSPASYAQAVTRAGGVPILLPCEVDHVDRYVAMCDGFVFSGGDDPDTTPFGEPTHPAAKVMHPARQAFETALLEKLRSTTQPVLGVCLGMQMMALCAGGSLHQHLPEAPLITPAQAEAHRDAPHDITCIIDAHPLLPPHGSVYSRHHQAVRDAGSLRCVAVSDTPNTGRVIEAIDLPDAERFYLGVQWHPERTEAAALGIGLFKALISRAMKK